MLSSYSPPGTMGLVYVVSYYSGINETPIFSSSELNTTNHLFFWMYISLDIEIKSLFSNSSRNVQLYQFTANFTHNFISETLTVPHSCCYVILFFLLFFLYFPHYLVKSKCNSPNNFRKYYYQQTVNWKNNNLSSWR